MVCKKWKPPYLPTEEELKARVDSMRWLMDNGFDPQSIEAIMVKEEVDLEFVCRLVQKRGKQEARRIIKELLED